MLPWAHAAFGYVLYRGGRAVADRGAPGETATLALALGTQFPDLIDKPGAWTFAVVPAGRSLAHSLVVLVPLVAALCVLAWPAHRGTVAAFAVGLASHVFGDAWWNLVAGEFGELAFLAWPLLPVEPDHDHGFLAFFTSLELTTPVAVGLGVTAVGVVVWHRDGRPGVARSLEWGRRVARAV